MIQKKAGVEVILKIHQELQSSFLDRDGALPGAN